VRVYRPLHGVAPSGSDGPASGIIRAARLPHILGQASRIRGVVTVCRLEAVLGLDALHVLVVLSTSAGFQVPRLGKAFDRSVFSASLDASLQARHAHTSKLARAHLATSSAPPPGRRTHTRVDRDARWGATRREQDGRRGHEVSPQSCGAIFAGRRHGGGAQGQHVRGSNAADGVVCIRSSAVSSASLASFSLAFMQSLGSHLHARFGSPQIRHLWSHSATNIYSSSSTNNQYVVIH
jgi:hypothetical protein